VTAAHPGPVRPGPAQPATTPLRGLTWDHPRGYRVLDALAATAGSDEAVRWQRQPLADFESRPLRTLAGDFDLLVIDHPGLGEAVRDGSLQPLDGLFTAGELAGWRAAAVGASFDSYRLGGRQWALPLDAAAQVSVCRPDLLAERPASWADAVRIASEQRSVLCLGGPHALLMFAAICVASGTWPATAPGEFVPAAAGAAALDVMARLLAYADSELSRRNPIGVLDAMTAPGGPAYCPLVYGYVTYHRPDSGRPRLAAFDAPAGPGGTGSVLGGTGIAVTRSCSQPAAAAALLRTLLSDPVQVGRYAQLGGQSSVRQAWQDGDANRRNGGFYAATRRTIESAWLRPRFAGYPAFQTAASAVLREGLLSGANHGALLRRIGDLFARAQQPGSPASDAAESGLPESGLPGSSVPGSSVPGSGVPERGAR
jgi:multiple sugar transport system substrate-binding protein